MRPVFLVGMCTAMRQGDCCRLKWEDVDLEEGFITVTTSKTGETAEISLFPILREEIAKRTRKSEYVLPEVAALYVRKNFGMSWRVKQVLTAAIQRIMTFKKTAAQIAQIRKTVIHLTELMQLIDPMLADKAVAGDEAKEMFDALNKTRLEILNLWADGESAKELEAQLPK